MRRLLKKMLCYALLIALLSSSATVLAEADVPKAAPLITDSTTTDGMIRVALSSISGKPTYSITVSGSYKLGDLSLSDGATVLLEFTDGTIYATVNGTRTNLGTSATFRRGSGSLKIAEASSPSNTYPGNLQLGYAGGAASLICTLFIEDYVSGVLPNEMDDSYPLEALKAQAVIARTHAIRAKTASGDYDLTDTISGHVFAGVNSSKSRSLQAVQETAGIVITYNGSYVDASFGVSNGGQTELNSNAWNTSQAGYLQMKDDPYDLANSSSPAKTYILHDKPGNSASADAYTLITTAMAEALGGSAGNYTIEQITDVSLQTPKYSSPSRLYTQLQVKAQYNGGTETTVTLPIFPTVKSTLNLGLNTTDNELFYVTREADSYRITARRYGSGVGMSQRGAQQMANQGLTYAQILGFYFDGIQLSKKTFSEGWSTGDTISPSTTISPMTTATTSATVAPGTTVATALSTGTVSLQNQSSRLNLRATPQTLGLIIARIPNGTTLSILGVSGDWYQVQYGGLTGYVSKSFVSISQTGSTSGSGSSAVTGQVAYISVQSGAVALRSEAQAAASVLANLSHGTAVTVLQYGDVWTKVQYGLLTGYVPTQYLRVTNQITSGDGSTAVVVVSDANGNLNLRDQPSTLGNILLLIPNGSTVTVVEKQTNWSKITYRGVTGYAVNQYLRFGSSGSTATASPTISPTQTWQAVVKLTSGSLNVRSSPNATSTILTKIPNGTTVTVTQLGNEWCMITYGSYTGYVMRKFLSIASVPNPTATPAVTVYATVRTNDNSNVAIRAETNTSSTVVAYAPSGTQVQVLQSDSTWSYVAYGAIKGYMSTAYLVFTTTTPAPTATAQPTALPTGSTYYAYAVTQSGTGNVNLRASASTDATILQKVPHGTRVQVLQVGSEWTMVQVGTLTGYMNNQYLSLNPPSTGSATATLSPEANALTTAINTGVVTLSEGFNAQLSLRAAPDSNATVLATLPHNTQVDILQYTGSYAEWVLVRSGAYKGYAPRASITLQQSVAYINITDGSSSVSVYSSADSTSTVISVLQQNTYVTFITNQSEDWAQVRLANGSAGYVMRKYVVYI